MVGTNTITALWPKSFRQCTVANNGNNAITPADNYCNDGFGRWFQPYLNGGSSADVSVTVNCVEDDPTAVVDLAWFSEDTVGTTIDAQNNDIDPMAQQHH
jgi:hypothetical protein